MNPCAVETETSAIVFTLGVDVSALTLVGALITGCEGTRVDTAGKTRVLDDVAGWLAYDPAAGDFHAAHAPYTVRVQFTNASGRTIYLPDGPALVLSIVHPRA